MSLHAIYSSYLNTIHPDTSVGGYAPPQWMTFDINAASFLGGGWLCRILTIDLGQLRMATQVLEDSQKRRGHKALRCQSSASKGSAAATGQHDGSETIDAPGLPEGMQGLRREH